MNVNCDIILDLLPLYADDCCSEESRKLVSEHLHSCEKCRAAFESMNAELKFNAPEMNVGLKKVSERKANVLQLLMFFLSCGAMIFGAFLENSFPYGRLNGAGACAIIIPAFAALIATVGFLFVKEYKSAKNFRMSSVGVFAAACAGGYIWALCHYGVIELKWAMLLSAVITAVLGAIIFLCAKKYAELVGKE